MLKQITKYKRRYKTLFFFLFLIIFSSLISCNNQSKIPYTLCDCYENYYDVERGKYDEFLIRGNFLRSDILRKNVKNKTDEVVQFIYLDKEDQQIRKQCIKKYGDEVEQFGECE